MTSRENYQTKVLSDYQTRLKMLDSCSQLFLSRLQSFFSPFHLQNYPVSISSTNNNQQTTCNTGFNRTRQV